MEIIIDGFDFWNMEAQKYWSFPKSYEMSKQKEMAKYFCVSGEYYGARKVDGFWGMIIKDLEGNYYLRSRTESKNGGYVNKAEWIPQIVAGLEKLPNGTVLIGEVYFPNNEGSRKVTTVLNCLKEKCLGRQESGEKLNFYVFDVVAYDGNSLIDTEFYDRITNYLSKIDKATYIQIAEYLCGDPLWKLYNESIAAGQEGIVITKNTTKYLCGKRTAKATLKLKKELQDTIDCFITGSYKLATRNYNGNSIETWQLWENVRTGEKVKGNFFEEYNEGGPYEPVTKAYFNNWASSIELAVLDDNENVIPIAWVSGITEEIKNQITLENTPLKYQVVEVTAMEIECINSQYSLRHGKIVGFREDKTIADCRYSQIATK